MLGIFRTCDGLPLTFEMPCLFHQNSKFNQLKGLKCPFGAPLLLHFVVIQMIQPGGGIRDSTSRAQLPPFMNSWNSIKNTGDFFHTQMPTSYKTLARWIFTYWLVLITLNNLLLFWPKGLQDNQLKM